MKKVYNFLFLLFAIGAMAQNAPINFEDDGEGQNWTWTVFENDTNPPLEIVVNPDASGLNTSTTVAKFTALQSGQPFVGVESMHGSDIGTFDLTAENAFVSLMVYKPIISDVGIKYVTPSSGAQMEIKVPNTLINEWENISIDFTDYIGLPETTNLDQIVVFPDFATRAQDNVLYFDNIQFSDQALGVNTIKVPRIYVYPNPANTSINIKSSALLEQAVLYNSIGQKIKQIDVNAIDFNIDISALSSGIYTLVTSNETVKQTTKFIKE